MPTRNSPLPAVREFGAGSGCPCPARPGSRRAVGRSVVQKYGASHQPPTPARRARGADGDRANRHDAGVCGSVPDLNGRPCCRHDKRPTDPSEDLARCRQHVHQRRCIARLARRGIETPDRLGDHRWGRARMSGVPRLASCACASSDLCNPLSLGSSSLAPWTGFVSRAKPYCNASPRRSGIRNSVARMSST